MEPFHTVLLLAGSPRATLANALCRGPLCTALSQVPSKGELFPRGELAWLSAFAGPFRFLRPGTVIDLFACETISL